MPNEIKQKTSTQICFADHSGDFSPAAGTSLEQGTPTDVQLSLASVADSGFRQSAKFDFGATRAAQYDVIAALEFAATPTSGDVCYMYLAESPDSTAGNGNPGNASGSDAAYTGYSSNASDSVRHMKLIGIFVCTAQATSTVQVAKCGRFSPGARYGCLIFRNESGATMHSDDVECHIVFEPVLDEIQ